MISAINNQGKLPWMTRNDALNTETFTRFLQQLVYSYQTGWCGGGIAESALLECPDPLALTRR